MLQEAIIHLPEDRDSDERGTYASDMEGHSENDLHNALGDMADGGIASGAVYSDVPKCILFEQASTSNAIFPEMGSTAIPVFYLSSPVKIGNMSVTRHQVPVTPAWAITEYKAEGSTYDRVTVDLHWENISSKDGPSHKRYCSSYVQLTRTRSLQGLSLLQPVTLKDLSGKPDKLLVVEDQRIAELAMLTETAWKQIESSPRFR